MENTEVIICPLCGRTFKTKQSLAMHMVACAAKKKIEEEKIADSIDNNITDNIDNNSTLNNTEDSTLNIVEDSIVNIVEEPKDELTIKINELNLFIKSIRKSSVSPQEIDKMFDYYVWFTKKPKPSTTCHQCIYDVYMCLMENIKLYSHLLTT